MSKRANPIRWSIERRLQFIEFRLYWDGAVNRSDLVDYFGISVPQASADLARYQDMAGRNLRYDPQVKAYVATAQFSPVFTDPTARRYLAQLRAIADDVLTPEETWFGRIPPYYAVPSVRRTLDVDTLRGVVSAIHTSSALKVQYQSFGRPEPSWRWITPHALGFDGHRWHCRAWCHEHNEFRDFVLARILQLSDRKPHPIESNDDLEWRTELNVCLGPHPGMSEAMRRAIEFDYGMIDGKVEIWMRFCTFYYFERQFRLDLDPDTVDPESQQIVLVNREEVDAIKRTVQQAGAERVGSGLVRR